MRRSGLFLGAFVVLGACSSHPEAPARPAGTLGVKPAAPPASATAGERPRTPADWLRSAEEAEKLGNLDVANAFRGRAYALEHDIPILTTWIDGLIATGEHELARRAWAEARRTAEQKGGADFAKRIDEKIAALPKPAAPVPLEPAAISEPMRGAYEAEADGRTGEAVTAFAQAMGGAPDPHHLAHAASLRWRTGDLVEARRAWSKARVLLREAGAGFELVPVTDWYTEQAYWYRDKLALQRILQPIEPGGAQMSEFQIWSLAPSPQPVLRLYSASSPRAVTLSEDGRLLLQSDGGAIVVRDTLSGVAVQRIETGEKELGSVSATGAGDKLRVLTTAGASVKLWDAGGKLLNEYKLEGTTPTIMRVYRAGRGTMHDNVLRDSPTWAVSAAISKDLRFAAAGGSDSKVRLFDRTTGAKRVLEYKWAYEERRLMGGNPDLNEPVDMRFTEKGDRLLVVYRHGEIITWSTADGSKVRTLDGACSTAEATIVANRYTGPNDPKQVPTAEDREGCGRPVVARFDPELRSVVTTGSAVRVRDVASGAGVALLIDEDLANEFLAWSHTGTLAMVSLYGAVSLWSPGDRASRHVVKANRSGPIDPEISSSGRFVWFENGDRDVALDLVEKKELPLAAGPRTILGLSSDGALVARRGEGGIEIADTKAGAVVVKYPVPKDQRAWAQLAAAGKKALLRVEHYPAQSIVLCDLARAQCKDATFGAATGLVEISEDGRWVAAEAQDGILDVWDAAAGKSVLATGKEIRNMAFAKEGGAVAWIEQPDRQARRVIAHFRRLDGAGDAKTQDLELQGWPSDIALSPDGAQVWVLLQGTLTRWKPGSDSGVTFQETSIIGARKVKVSDDGKTIFLTGYDHIAIRANDPALRPLARLYPLLSGGFLTVSASGAVDGTTDAPLSVATRVTRDKETLGFDGYLGWDAAHVEGVLARALAGESVEPPIPGANGSGVTSL